MSALVSLYRYLPSRLQTVTRELYDRYQRRQFPDEDRRLFLDTFFEAGEYDRYVEEFESGPALDIRQRAQEEFDAETPSGVSFGDVRQPVGRDLYALTRTLRPDVVVETGVCNGFSTLCLLTALQVNERGHLYSVDYPYRADESLDQFREETFHQYGGAAIPADREPGWLIPSPLRDRWSLTLGRSQRELPGLLEDLGDVDVFLHDSEHSVPCMHFEFELAWEFLADSGVLLADDVSWNDAFETFTALRAGQSGYIAPNVGYALR
jgi:hypothetical protein